MLRNECCVGYWKAGSLTEKGSLTMASTAFNRKPYAGKPHVRGGASGKRSLGVSLWIRRICLVTCAMTMAVASASAIDTALVWRSGDGLDPSGAFSAATESVPATWNGRETEQTVLKINQTKAESLGIPLSGILLANCHALTMYMRCKWDGDFFSGDRAYLFSYGNPWGEYRGSSFSFINLADGTASVRWDCGRSQGPQSTPTIQHDTWYDVFMTVEDPWPNATAAHNVYIHAYLMKVGDAGFTGSDISGNWVSWRTDTGDYQSAELRTTDSLTFGSNFKGTIAQLGFWNRVLSSAERCEVAATPNDGGNLIRTGMIELTAAQPEVCLAFHESGHKVYDTTKGASAPAYVATLDQALSLIAADDSAAGSVEAVVDEGTAKAREIRLHPVVPGKESLGYAGKFSTGDHVLTLRWKNVTATKPLKLKKVTLGGSWSIGPYIYAIQSNDANPYKGSLAPYVIGMNMPERMTGGLSAATDPLQNEGQMIKFELTKRQAELAYRYEMGVGQTKDNAGPKIVIYVNGAEFIRTKIDWQFGNGEVIFPSGTFREGENCIAIRYDPADYPSGYWATFRSHRLTVQKDSFPKFDFVVIYR